MMEYQSTRNPELHATAAQAVLQGLAPDGGLYTMPSLAQVKLDWQAVLQLDTLSMAREILAALLPSYDKEEMNKLVHAAYAGRFETSDLTPTVSVGEDAVLELFRGPTSAFKDVALSMLPRLMTGGAGEVRRRGRDPDPDRHQRATRERPPWRAFRMCRARRSSCSIPMAASAPCSSGRWKASWAATCACAPSGATSTMPRPA